MSPGPPRWARWVVRLTAPSRDRSAIEGDLAEGFRRRVESVGSSSARRWYARQALRSIGPLMLSSIEGPAARRFVAGAFLGIGLTSFAPFLLDRLVRPVLPGEGLFLTLWFISVSVVAALSGGYVAVRTARVRAVSPILALAWLFYAPAVLHLARNPERLLVEGGWLLMVVSTATAAGLLAGHRNPAPSSIDPA